MMSLLTGLRRLSVKTTNNNLLPGATHVVFNQAKPLENYNAFSCDPALTEALAENNCDTWAHKHIDTFGALAGSKEWLWKSRKAHQNSPILHTHDRFGNRIDFVEFHPYYHGIEITSCIPLLYFSCHEYVTYFHQDVILLTATYVPIS